MSASTKLSFNQIIALCRPGFENDCANELMSHTMNPSKRININAYIKAKPNAGYVQLIISNGNTETDACELMESIKFGQLIFTRQWFASPIEITKLSEEDRVTAIKKFIENYDLYFDEIELGYADTNTGKSLSKFCKQFIPHLNRALNGTRHKINTGENKLIIFFIDSTHAFIGTCQSNNSASNAMGIARLRMPASAPSRSTLKLEEAIITFLSSEQQNTLIKPGMRAVDLGAAPGGWTWQLIRRQMFVTAIDNGPMDKELMRTEMVEHLKVDAFTYSQKKVSWLVCDMVEQPHRVSHLIAKWFNNNWCQHAIFNLKLPMKKRYEAIKQCEKILYKALDACELEYKLQIKQLFHDREEVTVCILQQPKH